MSPQSCKAPRLIRGAESASPMLLCFLLGIVGALIVACDPKPALPLPPKPPPPAALPDLPRASQLPAPFTPAYEALQAGDFSNATLQCKTQIEEIQQHLSTLLFSLEEDGEVAPVIAARAALKQLLYEPPLTLIVSRDRFIFTPPITHLCTLAAISSQRWQLAIDWLHPLSTAPQRTPQDLAILRTILCNTTPGDSPERAAEHPLMPKNIDPRCAPTHPRTLKVTPKEAKSQTTPK